MAAIDATASDVKPFDSSKPFDPKSVSYKHLTFTAVAKKRNRLMLQQNFDIEEECAICLTSMLNKPVLYTPCKHRFHSRCMFALLGGPHLSRSKCPLCRFDLTPAIMKLYGDDVRLGLLMIFLVGVAPRNEGAGHEVVGANEPVSLFDEESDVDYEEEDSDYDSDEETDSEPE